MTLTPGADAWVPYARGVKTWDDPESSPLEDIDGRIRRLAAAAPTGNRTATLLLSRRDLDRYREEFGDDLESIVEALAHGFGFAHGTIELLEEYGPKGQRGMGFDGLP